MEKHVLTPFGGIDINFRMPVQTAPKKPRYEVDVEGDIDHWLLEADLMDEFKKSLMDFIRSISKECMEYIRCDTEEIHVRFKGTDFRLRTSWAHNKRDEQSSSSGEASRPEPRADSDLPPTDSSATWNE